MPHPTARLAFLWAALACVLGTHALLSRPAAWPAPWWTCLGIMLLGTACIEGAEHLNRRSHHLRVAGVGLFTVLPVADHLTREGVPFTHDLAVHSWAIYGTARAQAGGDWWPLWLDVVGVGQPVGLFYAPVPYLLGGTIARLSDIPTSITLLSWFTGALMALSTAWVLAKRDHGPHTTAWVAVAAVLAPYRLLQVDYRFALGEALGLALCLPTLHLVERTAYHRDRSAPALLAALSSLLVATHGLSVLMVGMGASVLLTISARTHTLILPRLLTAAGLSALISAPILLPLLLEAQATGIAQAVPSTSAAFASHGLTGLQSLTPIPWDGFFLSDDLQTTNALVAAGQPAHEMPLYLGGIVATGLLAGLWLPAVRAWVAVGLGAWLCSHAIPAEWFGLLPPVRALQFPWRLLGLATVAALVPLAHLLKGRGRRVHLAFALAVLLDAWPALGAHTWVSWHPTHSAQQFAATLHEHDALEMVGTPMDLTQVPAITSGWTGPATGDVPPRVVGALLPPRVPRTALANVWRAAPEYFNHHTRELLTGLDQQDHATLFEADVGWLIERDVTSLPTPGRLTLRTQEGELPVAAQLDRRSPSTAKWLLPPDLPAGRLIWREQAFPGWRASVDGGPWTDVPPGRWQALEVTGGARKVVFQFTRSTPSRSGGLGLGLLGLLMWCSTVRRAQR